MASLGRSSKQMSMAHELWRALVYDAHTLPGLVCFFSRRDPLPAHVYPYLASYFDLLWEDAVILGDEWDVTEWDKWRQERREIYETLPRTQELWSLPDYAENEYYYLRAARDRDRWMGIPIESDEAII